MMPDKAARENRTAPMLRDTAPTTERSKKARISILNLPESRAMLTWRNSTAVLPALNNATPTCGRTI